MGEQTVDAEQLYDLLFDPNEARWYDWLATLQHSMHFVLPRIPIQWFRRIGPSSDWQNLHAIRSG